MLSWITLFIDQRGFLTTKCGCVCTANFTKLRQKEAGKFTQPINAICVIYLFVLARGIVSASIITECDTKKEL